MKKLLAGIVDFRERVRPAYRETFARLALEHKPDCLMIACSDSRVVPNLFASTDPGDLFVVRNIGNFVPPWDGAAARDRSAGAGVEFAVDVLGVRDVVVVGHSECGAMNALLKGGVPEDARTLNAWLDLGRPALGRLTDPVGIGLAPHDRLSQISTLAQIENLRTYPAVRRRLEAGTLRLHAWWFDIAQAEVRAWDEDVQRFDPIVSAAE